MRRRGAWGTTAAASVVALALGGCAVPTANPLPDLRFQANTPVGALVRHVTPVWTAPLHPAGATVATADTLVAIDLPDGGQPEAVALDLATGRELWRRPAGTGAPAPGARLDAVLATTPEGNAVTAFFARAGDPKAPVSVVLADPRTGDQRVVEVPGAVNLGPCKVVGGLCAEQLGPRGERTPIRIDPVTGKAERLVLKQGPLDRIADLGGGVYLARRENKTYVGRVGEDAWEKPLAEWVGADVELPATLSWAHVDPASGQLGITLRRRPLTDTDLKVPVSELTSVVVEIGTGEKIWDGQGVSLWCPGGAPGVTCAGELAYTRRDRSTRTFTPAAGLVTYAGLSAGGDAPWSHKLRGLESPVGPKGTSLRAPSGMWLFRQGDRLQLGDPTTGELTPLDDTHWFACQSTRTVPVGATKVTAAAYRPCTSGTVSDEPAQFTVAGVLAAATAQPKDSLGEEVPGFYVVTMPDRLAAFR